MAHSIRQINTCIGRHALRRTTTYFRQEQANAQFHRSRKTSPAYDHSPTSWSIKPGIQDSHPIAVHPLGAIPPASVKLAAKTHKLDLKKILSHVPRNPYLVERRIANSILPASARHVRGTPGSPLG